MADDAPVVLGVDLGTSGIKVVAVDDEGRTVARARAGYPTARPEPDAAEQDPADWYAALDRALEALRAEVDPARWAGMGLSAMLPTLVSLDADDEPIGPALTWEDGRAEPDAERLLARVGALGVARTTGQQLDGRYLLPMHVRRLRLGPAAGGTGADAGVAGAKDVLFRHLTGELLTDPSTAAGYGAYALRTGAWDPELLAAAEVARVPAVAASATARPLRAALAERWGCAEALPVVLGAADSVLGAYGLGVTRPTAIAYIAGTSNVVLACAPRLPDDPEGRYLVTPLAAGGFGVELDLMTSGSAVAWLAALTGTDASALAEEAEATALADAPIVLPYLAPGEQGALWDPELVGAVEGITLRTTRAELARGLLGGIVLETRRCLDALPEELRGSAREIVVSGSGGRAAVFRQDLADATGRRVVFDPREHDHSAVGAARLAGRVLRGWPEPEVRHDGALVAEPDPEAAAAWRERFARHERLRLSQRESRER